MGKQIIPGKGSHSVWGILVPPVEHSREGGSRSRGTGTCGRAVGARTLNSSLAWTDESGSRGALGPADPLQQVPSKAGVGSGRDVGVGQRLQPLLWKQNGWGSVGPSL